MGNGEKTGREMGAAGTAPSLSQIPGSAPEMFNVSALLPYDALLKCVVTEVVLFSIVAFKTLTFHKVM